VFFDDGEESSSLNIPAEIFSAFLVVPITSSFSEKGYRDESMSFLMEKQKYS